MSEDSRRASGDEGHWAAAVSWLTLGFCSLCSDFCLFSSVPTFAFYPHEKGKKKERRPGHLHQPSWYLAPGATAMRTGWTLVQEADTWSQASGTVVWNTAALAPGGQKDAVYQHWVSELILVTFEKSLSVGIKLMEEEFFCLPHMSRSNLCLPNITSIISPPIILNRHIPETFCLCL